MSAARWSFRPAWWAVLGTLLGVAVTCRLGLWQVHRGQDKQALQDRYVSASSQAPLPLVASTPARRGEVISALATGRYVAERQLLLDNQSRGRQPGYDVWTPLRLASGGLVMINRGWTPAPASRTELPMLPAPDGDQQLHGLWRALPEPGLRVVSKDCLQARSFPVIVNYPTAAELACLIGEPVAAGEFLLDAREPGGYVREWNTATSEFPPQRHYAYAAQWFTFALTLLAIFIKLNLKKTHD